jgi:PAS domain S-box-containing protein
VSKPRSPRKQPKRTGPARTVYGDSLVAAHLLENIPDAIVVVDEAGAIVQVNAKTEELFGYTRRQLVGRKLEMLVPSRYQHNHAHHRQGFVHKPKPRRMGSGLDLWGRRRDGSEFPVDILLNPISTKEGTLVFSAIRDISEQKRMEGELRRAQEELNRRTTQELSGYRSRLAAIVDSSEDAIIGKTLDGIITHWNKGAERIYGYRAEEIVGKSITLLAPPDRKNEILQILDQIRRGERLEPFETVRFTKDGRRLDVSISVSPIPDADGTIVGASAIARDITAQKRAEEQLQQSQKMEAIGRLAGGVAHDFNNVLGIITACADLLHGRMDAGGESSLYVDTLKKAAERGASLTRQLLAFSRKQSAQPQVLDLNERLKEVSKLVRPLMGDDVEMSILPRSGSAIVEVDPAQLDQVVLNLAVNARDAMPHGGKLVIETDTVDFDESVANQHRPMTPGRYVMLAVSDTGTGMDRETASRIFEPFFTTKELGKGTGLGLSTVYGIVRQAGGQIWVYSEPGRGSTFKAYFPCAESKIGVAQEPPPEEAIPTRLGSIILVVEDDDIMRALTRKMLEEAGYSVLEAKDGQSALDLVSKKDGRIDLVLTDVVMRGLSGPELALRINALHPEMRVVYMSGYTGELISEHDGLQRNIELLEKPFTRVALLRSVNAALA